MQLRKNKEAVKQFVLILKFVYGFAIIVLLQKEIHENLIG